MSLRSRHRHLVAFPIFVAVLSLSLLPTVRFSSSLTASVTDAQEVISLEGGAQVLPGEGSALDTSAGVPFLRNGQLLMHSEGIVQLRTAHGYVLGVAGAFHVVADETSATVSAITAPVLVSVAGRRALVTPGMQLRLQGPLTGPEAGFASWREVRVTDPLPEHFLRDQLLALKHFGPAHDVLPLAEAVPADEPVMAALNLPAAQERAKEEWRLQVLGALRLHIEQGNEAEARAMLSRPAFRMALTDPRSLSPLVVLAARAPDGAAGLRPLLLGFLFDRHDLWLLAALHPVFHTGAWSAGVPALAAEESALLAFGLPEADRASQGFSPVVTRWWAESVTAFIADQQQDPLPLIEPLLTALLPVVERSMEEGYPERAQTLARSLQSFAEPVASRLSATLTLALTKAQRLTEVQANLFASSATSASSVSSQGSSVPSQPVLTPINPEERVMIVTAALEQAGALFSLQTTIEPKEDGQAVTVRDILFASPKGDLSYMFDVDVPTLQVSSIVQEGKLLPYPMSLDAFLQWVRQ